MHEFYVLPLSSGKRPTAIKASATDASSGFTAWSTPRILLNATSPATPGHRGYLYPINRMVIDPFTNDWCVHKLMIGFWIFFNFIFFQIACGVYAFRVPGAGCADVTMRVLRESNAKWFAFVQCYSFIQLYNIFCSFHSPPAHYHLGYCHAIGDAEVPPLARLRSAVVMAVVYGR